MSAGQGNGQRNRIRGPQSALTDFLASQNISADQIRRDYEARTQRQQQQAAAQNTETTDTPVSEGKRKRVDKAEKKPAKKGRKKTKATKDKGSDAGSEDGDSKYPEFDDILSQRRTKRPRVAGQLDNCAICEKRFTVTGYTKAGPQGGLLCPKCSKDVDKSDETKKPTKTKVRNRHKKRQLRSDMLDGRHKRGARSLVDVCIQRIADHFEDVEDLGILPSSILQQLSHIFTKRRILDSRTIGLFLRPEYDTVMFQDCAKLTASDYMRIFAVCPDIKNLELYEALHFNDEVLQYVIGNPAINLVQFRVWGANLINDELWRKFFAAKGAMLEDIKIGAIDGHFDDDTFSELGRYCPKVTNLDLELLCNLSRKAFDTIASMTNLRHLRVLKPKLVIDSTHVLGMLEAISGNLETLHLERFPDICDDVLDAIHNKCEHLSDLLITDNTRFTDSGFVKLFTDWRNPPLKRINFRACRHVNANSPVLNPDNVGLCSEGFRALMKHSGPALEQLHVTSCRHISHAAFADVFDGVKMYPRLEEICVSFCGEVDDAVIAGMFRSCRNLNKIQIFACYRLTKDVFNRRGAILMGHPNTQSELIMYGEDDLPDD